MVEVIIHIVLLIFGPLTLLGFIDRVKSRAARRAGPPILQRWYDVAKLLRKGAVYSRTTTIFFKAGPMVALACTAIAALVVPLTGDKAPLSFSGDIFLFSGLLVLGRFAMLLAAMDTGSAFEGMGASREAAFGAMAEPALFLVLLVATMPCGDASFSTAFSQMADTGGLTRDPGLLLAAIAFGAFLVTDLARIPIDDPTTHLELTMIHEVVVLDHSGPDLAFVTMGYALRMWILSAIFVHLLIPVPSGAPLLAVGTMLAGQFIVAIGVGITESIIARLRMTRIPQFLIAASVIAAIGILVQFLGVA